MALTFSIHSERTGKLPNVTVAKNIMNIQQLELIATSQRGYANKGLTSQEKISAKIANINKTTKHGS